MPTTCHLLAGTALAATLALAGTAFSAERTDLTQLPEGAATTPHTAAAQEFAGAAAPVHFGAWGFDMTGVDQKAKPGDSFYEFANGIWDVRTTNSFGSLPVRPVRFADRSHPG